MVQEWAKEWLSSVRQLLLPETLNNSLKNIKISRPDLLQSKTLEFILKDARWGHAEGGPYDVIFFGAGTTEVSKTILSQLKPNGRIVAPVGNVWRQNLSVIDKGPDGSISSKILRRVSSDFLCNLEYQLHPDVFPQPLNTSAEDTYTKMFPPPPGVRPRAVTFPLSSQERSPGNGSTKKYEFLPESTEDRYIFPQHILDILHGPNKTKSRHVQSKVTLLI
ncbi:protein-L-isoaspartate O-methyltransferase 1-like [Diaphorina citri]|uniref:protein-L-isoaspartate(D-aspartate) O-methyltransferase n=1 Tax=Diaphorina citri TaxID=121845 RepID=A0A1S3CWM6_DIACI|nr:protein-L-isoaspartate O-methyltransferase 1-like [Diaphorina citri]